MFKVGDWVRVNKFGKAEMDFVVKAKNYHFSQDYIIELWQPKKGEWVVLKPRHPRMHKETSFTIKQYFGKNCNGVDIEPFIGELPSFVKDNK